MVSLEAEQDAEKFSEPQALRKLARQNKYEIKAVSWCPHPAKEGLLASAVSAHSYHLVYLIGSSERHILVIVGFNFYRWVEVKLENDLCSSALYVLLSYLEEFLHTVRMLQNL